MRFLLDANVRYSIGEHLIAAGHDVRCIAGTFDRRLPDEAVLRLAVEDRRILVTNDKDFGQLIHLEHRPHHGVILFRMNEESPERYWQVLEYVIQQYSDELSTQFIVLTDQSIRIRSGNQ